MSTRLRPLLPLLGAAVFAWAVEPAPLFRDGMVLQRDMPVPVWGGGNPGEQVTVRFAGQSKAVVADAAGRWRVNLDALGAAAKPRELVIAGATTVTVQDVLVGEVWLCSGQSNMEWSMKGTLKPEQFAAVNPGADDPLMRFFTVERVTAIEPKVQAKGQWSPCTPASAATFSLTGYHFGAVLRKHLDVPVGLVVAAWGGMPSESFTSLEALKGDPAWPALEAEWTKKIADHPAAKERYETQTLPRWKAAVEKAKAEKKPLPNRPGPPPDRLHPQHPGNLYHSMIHPLIPFAFRGAIWYQGESNADNLAEANAYRTLFPTMIRDWRTRFGYDLPFLFVQLANFKAVQTRPVEDQAAWPVAREAQLLTLALPRTGMAVAIDVCDEPDNIHPRNKKLVGERLALAARKVAYGEDVVASGPIFTKATAEGASMRLAFDHAAGLKAAGDALKGFAIRGADGVWTWADARIDGTTVVVSAAAVPAPQAVRYGWAMNPIGNLVNGAGLPASPFRSDP